MMAAVARNILPDENSEVPADSYSGTRSSHYKPHICEANSYQACGRAMQVNW